jgi:hypothetical protein
MLAETTYVVRVRFLVRVDNKICPVDTGESWFYI